MKILLIGSGGREHALAWKLAQSEQVEKIFAAPGNGGTANEKKTENVAIGATELDKLVDFAKANQIDLAVVGPDDPLALGIVDEFQKAGLKIFGPTKAAAEIEASKSFAKGFMRRHGIPTAEFGVLKDAISAREYVAQSGVPTVIKASGLALGKGVFVCKTKEEAEQAIRQIFEEKIFGEAGNEAVIEEFLEGPEVSIHVLSDGEHYKIFPTAQDHKPVFDNDLGPNTGGMGTIVPLPQFEQLEQLRQIEQLIIHPAIRGMAAEGRKFVGLLYPGLKMTKSGPKVLEFNARFGDPETQSYMRLLESDLFEVLNACAQGRLEKVELKWSAGAACCVILASDGYPGKYEKGKEITGIVEAEKISGVKIFHAGTRSAGSGQAAKEVLVTNGGRVLGMTATGENLKEALDRAYQAAKKIFFEGKQLRHDIGAKSLQNQAVTS